MAGKKISAPLLVFKSYTISYKLITNPYRLLKKNKKNKKYLLNLIRAIIGIIDKIFYYSCGRNAYVYNIN